MGSKGSTSTSTVQIPPDVLNRYNAANTQAQAVAGTPFQQYSTDPSAFVAPLTPTQQGGIQTTNQYATAAQPYFDAATGQLIYAQGQATPYFGSSASQLGAAQGTGQGYADASVGALGQAQGAAADPNAAAWSAYNQAYGAAQPFNIGALQQYYAGLGAAQPYQTQAGQNIAGAQGAGALLAGSSMGSLAAADAASAPYYGSATGNITAAQQMGTGLSQAALGTLGQANAGNAPLLGASAGNITNAYNTAQPYNQMALGNINAGLSGGTQLNSLALQQYLSAIGNAGGLSGIGQGASSIASGGASGAMGAVNSGIANAAPWLSSAGTSYGNAIGAAAPLQGAAAQGFGQSLSSAAPWLNQSGQYIGQGAQAVNPTALDDAAINQYMSPYLNTVLQGTAGLLNQQNQQAMAGQLGNSIRSGAFGGDRAGIAAANLAQQQQLANAQIFSGILNQGYGQALGTAQQQQQLGLGAGQANRAALQNAAAQSLALGQERFGQGMTTAQAQAGLGSQLFGQQLGVGQAQAGLGEQYYNQGLGAAGIGIQGAGLGIQAQQIQAQLAQAQLQAQLQGAQGVAGLGAQQFGQGLSAAQAQQALGSQIYGQQLGTGTAQAGLAGQLFGQGLSTAQQQGQLAQQLYGIGSGTAQAQQGLGSQLFGQGLSTAQQQAALSNLLYGQQQGTGTAQAALGQQLFGQNQSLGQNIAGLGSQVYGQGTGFGQAAQGLGSQLFGQGLSASQQLGNLGAQQYGQGANTASQLAALAQAIYGTGASTSQGLANLGTGVQGAGLSGGQAQLAAGQAEQQTNQAGNTALYNQFLQQQSYPFQVAQFLANIAMGTGALSGNTTTTNQVANGIFSDRRLKTNVKPVGKTFDGQTIYSFRYKGEPHTEMGLIAQEVEKKHPGAVGQRDGFKTVDYGEATGAAAKRGHFAYGGAAGLGFDPGLMQQIMANYQSMYAPLTGAQGGLSAGNIVPAASLPVGQLQPAQAPAGAPPGAFQTAGDVARTGDMIGELGDKLGAWDWGGKDDDDERKGLASGGYTAPYGDPQGLGLAIPDERPDIEMLTANAPKPEQADPIGDIGKIAKTAASIAALIPSDRRLKENVKPVGKTFDGQTVYSYTFKGDKTPRMGLIAQEVEKKHPHAVGRRGGFKAVDYAKATDKAAKRGKFAEGGDVEEEETNPLLEELRRRLHPELYAEEEEASPDGMDDIFQAEAVAPAPDGEEEAADEVIEVPAESAAPALAAPASAGLRPAPPVDEAPPAPIKGGIAAIAGLIAKAEGTGKNPKSSAEGYGQFLDKTFVNTFRKTFPGEAGLSDSEILSRRGSGVEKPMLRKFTVDNANALSRAGFDPTPGNIYLAHFLGPAGAKTVLGADPDTPVAKLLDGAAVRANPSVLKGKTAADVADWAAGRIASMASPRRLATGGVVEDVEDALSDEEQAKQDAAARALIVAQRAADNTRPLQEVALPPSAVAPPAALPPAPAPQVPVMPPQMASAPPENLLPPAAPPAGLGMAANGPPENLLPAGLGAAAAPPPAESTLGQLALPNLMESEKPRGFFKGLKHGDASSIIPLLSGIGALATTQTNNPLTAIAAGLGAGAQASQGQREFARKSQETRAQALAAQTGYQGLTIRAKQAANEFKNAQTLGANAKIAWIDKYQPIAFALSAMGKPDKLLEQQIAAMNASIVADTGAPSVGDVAPTMEGADIKTPLGQQTAGLALGIAGAPGAEGLRQTAQNAKDTGRYINPDSGEVDVTPGAVGASQEQKAALSKVDQAITAQTDAFKTGMAAFEARSAAEKMASQLRNPDGSYKISGGPLEKYRTGVGNLLLSAGVPASIVSAITTTNPVDATSVGKLKMQLASQDLKMTLGSQFSQAEFAQFMDSVPGSEIPTAAALWLIDHVVIPKAETNINYAKYAQSLKPEDEGFLGKLTEWKDKHSWSGVQHGTPDKATVPKKGDVYYPTSAAQARSLPEGATFIYPPGSPYAGQRGTVKKGG